MIEARNRGFIADDFNPAGNEIVTRMFAKM